MNQDSRTTSMVSETNSERASGRGTSRGSFLESKPTPQVLWVEPPPAADNRKSMNLDEEKLDFFPLEGLAQPPPKAVSNRSVSRSVSLDRLRSISKSGVDIIRKHSKAGMQQARVFLRVTHGWEPKAIVLMAFFLMCFVTVMLRLHFDPSNKNYNIYFAAWLVIPAIPRVYVGAACFLEVHSKTVPPMAKTILTVYALAQFVFVLALALTSGRPDPKKGFVQTYEGNTKSIAIILDICFWVTFMAYVTNLRYLFRHVPSRSKVGWFINVPLCVVIFISEVIMIPFFGSTLAQSFGLVFVLVLFLFFLVIDRNKHLTNDPSYLILFVLGSFSAALAVGSTILRALNQKNLSQGGQIMIMAGFQISILLFEAAFEVVVERATNQTQRVKYMFVVILPNILYLEMAFMIVNLGYLLIVVLVLDFIRCVFMFSGYKQDAIIHLRKLLGKYHGDPQDQTVMGKDQVKKQLINRFNLCQLYTFAEVVSVFSIMLCLGVELLGNHLNVGVSTITHGLTSKSVVQQYYEYAALLVKTIISYIVSSHLLDRKAEGLAVYFRSLQEALEKGAGDGTNNKLAKMGGTDLRNTCTIQIIRSPSTQAIQHWNPSKNAELFWKSSSTYIGVSVAFIIPVVLQKVTLLRHSY
eukprot:c52698_g1_i1.p1 GENE.c52698_g1_i1~~c52698_g1_i1.p1  ORF type:complete len:637 (-),score=150.39 c52698_g1_i1:63-1973(-)